MYFPHRKHVMDGHDLFARSHSGLSARADCEPADPANTVTDRLNTLLNSSGPGYTLPLCPSQRYLIQAPILFAAPNQEIRTAGEPFGDDRATLVVNGPVSDGQGHTVAVDGTCASCSGVKLRHIQIDGTRQGHAPTNGGGNIEMGGGNSNQLIEFVRSYDPRSWSCLHIAEGPFTCNNVTVQNNDIGPCGSDLFQQWADGISLSCQNSLVRNNTIIDATDGGIVVFGSPGSLIENNTISVENSTLLGGINLVDYSPWSGNYTNTIVRDNVIYGGFASDRAEPGENKGENTEDAIVKIGIAIGPRTWFGDRYGQNVSANGVVLNNRLSGAFGYGIALTSAKNFTVTDNSMFGNTSFIGSRGPNCSTSDTTPTPAPFVMDPSNVQQSTTQLDFQNIPDGDGLTCILPPDGGDYWPFGGNPENPTTTDQGTPSPSSPDHSGLSSGAKAGIAIAVIVVFIILAIATWFIRRSAIERARSKAFVDTWNKNGYVQSKDRYPDGPSSGTSSYFPS